MPRPVNILAVQGGPADISSEINRRVLSEYIDKECSQDHYDVVSLSEMISHQYFCGVRDLSWLTQAEYINGPLISLISTKAKEYHCNFVVPFLERGKVRGEYYNSVAVVDRNGNLVMGRLQEGTRVACYRKVQLPLRNEEVFEPYYFHKGPGYVTFDTDCGRFGTLLCHDRSYPEAWRVLSLLGAEIVFVGVSTWPKRRAALYHPELQVMAVQNGVFVVLASKGGKETVEMERTFAGRSCIINPYGEILAEAPAHEGWKSVHAVIDLEEVQAYHTRYHYFRDRRPELYGIIASQFN